MSDIAPGYLRRPRHEVDLTDLAASFVEEEIGRFDFVKNWEQAKARGNMRERLIIWLDRLNVDADPDKLIEVINNLALTHAGRWR